MATEQTVIKVGGMSCQGCVKNVTGVLQALPGVGEVAVSLENGEARISHDPEKTAVAALRAAIEDAGFDAL
ncbi:MAG: heavy-metal-associated domain-containing protein [Betaproteobacteria bacterium]|uniref:Heavy-metal-associated domain-containing protein n=1 Tax=Candidatus Proximibacter danicus TaxID=2954365 RepID=A0A9D7K4J2_9PROT|nr:heavy-metal-associated domain-containing protein [Candidatus Proximibacter danicus]